MPEYRSAYVDRAASTGAIMRFIASTEDPGRDGMIVKADGWQLDNYRRNPVVLFGHRYGEPPIGRADVRIDGKRLIADVTFDLADPFAASVARKYTDGFLSAVSVGWDTLQTEQSANPSIRAVVTKAELLDISAVPVPGDPGALLERQRRGLQTLATDVLRVLDGGDDGQQRAAIPGHTTAKADEGMAWDAGAQVGQCPAESGPLRRMHAWVDSNADPDAKSAYKLPHHTAEGAVVLRGVMAAMARLMQAGTAIPDADRRGVYSHLAGHYRQFDREPPEFRTNAELDALAPGDVRGLFLCGEPDLIPEVFAEMAQRAGAVLSRQNKDDLEQAMTLIRGVIARAGTDDPASDDGEERAARLLHSVFMEVAR